MSPVGNNLLENLRPALQKPPLREAGGRWYFRQVDREEEVTDSFDRIKLGLKKFPRLYYFLIRVVSPVFGSFRSFDDFYADAHGIILNIGSGNEPRRPRVVNVDMIDYDNVDIVADIHQLPFRDNSIDAVYNSMVLEHVAEPRQVVGEIHRVLQPGGLVYTAVPFMQPFHASPHDYQRYTLPGLKHLHDGFEILASGVAAGPVSALLWVAQEFFASFFSFGNSSVRNFLIISIMLLTWPLKYLDLLCASLPTARNLASVFYVVARKPR
jgi:SAM-dependent methyltransferase